MKNIITLFSLITLVFSVEAADKYVTENVDIYLRRGPGSQYAYTNAVKAGEKVAELEKSADGKYTRIQLPNGSSAWIESNKLKDQPSLKVLVPTLESKLAEYKDKVDNAEQYRQNAINDYSEKLKQAEQTIESLQARNKELEQINKSQDTKLESMLNQVDDKRRDLIVTWFTYGGLVAGGGFLLGLILPAIMPGRRKKDRWMR
ncbi:MULTISPECIES: TIGR04211 family SH3 domain-containing protein [unclassified Gilliamella]|uniref:TIGR04211 family SH3 domain-containing protein n=1 Tax=unclassified Gilliamella TaxID=2685620 RepID=UPI00080EB435|nr:MULTISPECIES: TIGR04211 family SH3 domain-containing protein [Gilliamella]MCX8580389.1 TIGR04211 family SH3 domain-containing protein [Gilliamella sp. B3482]MCX8584904.1 TIGR04211 family SH3 domain-containing protein [Gilliamella sp. B3562]MCX8595995.1 TIGR04211 family SH3 domain-containing protein [Gilliamella sp. B3493]MCX8598193.1 TIGR04211 family SH3 domain-containing protein [Gilliamella sp. B3486]MCX8660036.1 TIGR04211 family SH3 domain-containing protein [Gilliamella sp. B2772]